MKIGFCNILYTKRDDRGGLGSHMQDLSQQLAKTGHQITILTSGQSKEYFEGKVRIVQLGNVPRFSGAWQILNPFYWFQRAAYMFRLAQYIRRNRFDVVEAAEGGAEQLLLVLFRPCPIVTKLHGNFRHIYNRPLLSAFIGFFERLAVAKSDGVYTSSFSYAQTIASEYHIPREIIRIIPYGIHVEELCKHVQQPQHEIKWIKPARTALLSAGSSPGRKGAALFLEAASLLEDLDIQFVLLCSDRSFDAPVRIPDNVMILGNLDRARFYSLLSDADIVVFPSYFESFGIAAYEAMLLEKIVVISRNVPLEGSAQNYKRSFVLNKLTGRALADGIRDIFTAKIQFLPSDAETLNRMKEEYDIRNVAQSVVSFYEEVLASAGNVSDHAADRCSVPVAMFKR